MDTQFFCYDHLKMCIILEVLFLGKCISSVAEHILCMETLPILSLLASLGSVEKDSCLKLWRTAANSV